MSFDIGHDGLNQRGHILEGAAPDAFVGDLAEPALHQVQPRGAGGDEMQVETRMAAQPAGHARVFVRAVVIDDKVQLQIRRGLPIHLRQKLQKLLVPMAGHAGSNHPSIEHAEGREQRGGAMPFIVMGLTGGQSRTQRQQGPRAVQCLNLTFLVDTQDQRAVRRVQIKPHYVEQFLHEARVGAQLERLGQMRLQLVRLPDALDRHATDALGFRHRPHGPMGGIRRRGFQRGFYHAAHESNRELRLAARSRRVLDDASQTLGGKPISPQLHGRTRQTHFDGNDLALLAGGRPQDNPSALNEALGYAPSTGVAGQGLSRLRLKLDGGGCPHARQHNRRWFICQENSGTWDTTLVTGKAHGPSVDYERQGKGASMDYVTRAFGMAGYSTPLVTADSTFIMADGTFIVLTKRPALSSRTTFGGKSEMKGNHARSHCFVLLMLSLPVVAADEPQAFLDEFESAPSAQLKDLDTPRVMCCHPMSIWEQIWRNGFHMRIYSSV